MSNQDATTSETNEHITDEYDPIKHFDLDICSHFHLPISYLDSKNTLKENIIEDLELIKPTDASGNAIFTQTFGSSSYQANAVMKELPKHYTSNIDYLKDTQKLLKGFSSKRSSETDEQVGEAVNIWKEIKGDTGFLDKFHYIGWEKWKHLNEQEYVLQFISMYSLSSPVLSLMVPFIICIIPLVVLKTRGIDITWQEYKSVLKVVAANHAICKIFTSFWQVSIEQKVYLLLSTGLYIYSIYQNFLTCLRFYNNMKKMHADILRIRKYLSFTDDAMTHFLNQCASLTTYSPFVKEVETNKEKLIAFKKRLNGVYGETICLQNVGQIGSMMKHFYEMFSSEECNSIFLYSFGFHGFLENLDGLREHIKKKNIGFSTFKKKGKQIFKKAYYGAHILEKRVTNDISIDDSLVITGPNASGKTTTLKTSLVNIILTQQFGCGYYKSGNITPFEHIHCYLNIPDTSGRDSLFQAEARRCKDIIDIIHKHRKERHFCVFDELYSGTNPDEAVVSATAFMRYIIANTKVRCILTTHFVSVCKSLEAENNVKNYHMHTEVTKTKSDKSFKYTYLLKKGISEVKGGLKVLSDMHYPAEILKNTQI